MSDGIGQRVDDLQLFNNRSWPAVADYHRERVLLLRLHMDEMDVEPVDVGYELRIAVELRLDLAPIVIACPIAGECLHRRQRHALRAVGNRFLFGPSRRENAPLE